MKYASVVKGRFLARPNRFIARVLIENEEYTVHVKNTGRCRELLVEGCTVYLAKAENEMRKTPYDLIAVEKVLEDGTPLLVNMDSQVVNDVVEEWLRAGKLFPNVRYLKREVTYGRSRFDFYLEDGDKKIFLEVKGVTLEDNGVASFPDAPTERGVKHLVELVISQNEGYEAYVLFVIQMKGIHLFRPNDERHKRFGDALRYAYVNGVKVLAYDCVITPDTISIDAPIEIAL